MMADLFAHTGGLKFGSPLKMLVNPQKRFLVTLFQDKDWITLLMIFIMVVAFFLAVTFLVRRTQEKKGVLAFTILFGLIFAALGTAIIRHTDAFFRPEAAIMILGLGLLFGSLTVFVKVMRSVVLTGLEVLFHNYMFKTGMRALFLGMIITAVVQSSSVTTSIVVPLAGAGILSVRQVFPYTLGANVGTTITAILAAISTGETIAMAVAFSHLLFNVLGIVTIYPARQLPIGLAQGLATLTLRSRVIPFFYIVLVFFVIPLCLIWISR
jgi:Na+/phosphate symporter